MSAGDLKLVDIIDSEQVRDSGVHRFEAYASDPVAGSENFQRSLQRWINHAHEEAKMDVPGLSASVHMLQHSQ